MTQRSVIRMTRMIIVFLLSLLFPAVTLSQRNETVLYSFGAKINDGTGPSGRLIFDNAGNIYGTTIAGGAFCQRNGGCGTVFELTPSSNGWTETVLYSFCENDVTGCPDGSEPQAGLATDKQGNLYGTTFLGGVGAGTVYELSPPAKPGSGWTEKVLWAFGKKSGDGKLPLFGSLNWDSSGNLLGTTQNGGKADLGTVFRLSQQPDGTWKEKILHQFTGNNGAYPQYGVAVDNSGRLYGTTESGGPANAGVVYMLSPTPDGNWTEQVLYRFDGQSAANPISPITIDHAGNLYGTFFVAGNPGCVLGKGCGGVFEFSPNADGGLTKHFFRFDGQNGALPMSGVIVDNKTGTIIGTTWSANNVYAIRGTKEEVLYQFCSQPGCTDGSGPTTGLLIRKLNKLYGVTAQGGTHNQGVVFALSQ